MCTSPKLAVNLGLVEGKHRIKFIGHPDYSYTFLINKYGKENVMLLPCGECVDCRKSYKREWSVRCMAEASLHNSNTFITLTYDDEHYRDYTDVREFQLFMKKLRSMTGLDGLKFFGCSEAGLKTGRYHFHLIIFGWFPDDAKFEYRNGLGQHFYSSKKLEKIWSNGFVVISDVSKDACAYVAGYTAKKDNEVKPGMIFMSRNPGLGYEYFKINASKIMKTGSCVIPGFGVVSIPRYGLNVLEKLGYDVSLIRDDRLSLSNNRLLSVAISQHAKSYDEVLTSCPVVTHERKRGL